MFTQLYSCIEKHIEMQGSVFYPLNQSDCWPYYHFSWQGCSIRYRLLTTFCHAETTGAKPLLLCSFYSLFKINFFFFFHFCKLSMNLSSSWPKSFSNSANPLLRVLLKTSTAVNYGQLLTYEQTGWKQSIAEPFRVMQLQNILKGITVRRRWHRGPIPLCSSTL